MRCVWFHEYPIGRLGIIEEDGKIAGILFAGEPDPKDIPTRRTPLIDEAVLQLEQYFRGERKVFSLPLHLPGTDFQRKVWAALESIPFGETRSYQDIAIAIGSPKAVRAVGGANHRNPIPIVIPCHRVVGKDGTLTGFGGGLPVKRFLLDHESANA